MLFLSHRLFIGLVVPTVMVSIGALVFIALAHHSMESYGVVAISGLAACAIALTVSALLLTIVHRRTLNWISWLWASGIGAFLLGLTLFLPWEAKQLLMRPAADLDRGLESFPEGAAVLVGIKYTVPDWVLSAMDMSPLVITVIAVVLIYSCQHRAAKRAETRLEE